MGKLYYNGNIITMESIDDSPQAILVEDGIICKVGSLEYVKSFANDTTEMVDLDGKTLMPAFIDGHGHISMYGQMINACNLSECETFEEIIVAFNKYVEAYDGEFTPDDIIFGFGYDHNFLPDGKHPTKEYLNQVSTTVPVYAMHTSGHMGCANDKLLEVAGITAQTEDPKGGMIGRVEGSSEPNGYLEENAMFGTMGIMRQRIKYDVVESMKKAQEVYMKNGITTAQDGATSDDNLKMFDMLAKQEKLVLDVVAYPMIVGGVVGSAGDSFVEYSEYANKYSNRFKLGGYKAVLDGSPQGKSAWLTEPYEGTDGYCSYSWFTEPQVEGFMAKAIKENQQILVHCNGDAAGDQFLRNYVKAYHKSENPNKANLRPVMIHCQTAREDQLDIMEKYDMIPSIFTGHVYYWGDVHVKNLGKHRGENVSPVQRSFDRGLVVNFHQDPPITNPKPLFSVWAAVNRITRGGKLIGEKQRCSVYDGLKAITINGAYSYFEEDSKGSIKEGKRADLVILDQNPLTIDTMLIKDIAILETIKDGVSYAW
ncbi:MAG: amidohydrolase [Clostridia bacterium]